MTLGRTIIVGWTLLCFCGCTSMQAIQDPTPDRIREQIEVGDEIHVTAKDGVTYDIEVTKVEEDSLTGRAESRKHYRVPYAAIASIEVRKVSAGKTGGALGVVALALYAAALYLVLVILDIGDTASGN